MSWIYVKHGCMKRNIDVWIEQIKMDNLVGYMNWGCIYPTISCQCTVPLGTAAKFYTCTTMGRLLRI